MSRRLQAVRRRLAFFDEYRAPYRAAVRRAGVWRAAPATWAFLALTLLVSLLWHIPGAHHAVLGCCAYRATDLAHWQRAARLAASAFLVLRPVEVAWSVAACWLLLAPLEAAVGTRRIVAVGAVGNLVPTLSTGLAWLASHPGAAGAPLDVGTSAMVVAAGAALVVWSRSLPIAALLVLALAVDVLVESDLATAEHLLALAVGVGSMLLLRSPERRSALQRAPRASPGSR